MKNLILLSSFFLVGATGTVWAEDKTVQDTVEANIAAIGINLEYQDLKYNSTEVESVGSVALNKDTSVDADTKGYSLSVSFPIEL